VRRWIYTLLASLAIASAGLAGEISPGQRALLLLRVLVYDRELPKRAGGVVLVAIVSRSGRDASEQEALLAAFEELSRSTRAAGLPVRAFALAFEGPAAFAAELTRARPAALYACANLREAAPDVAMAASRAGVLAFTGERRLVLEGGFPLALVDRGERAGLVLNPQAAAAAGSDLDSALLSVAELVRPEGLPPLPPIPAPPAGR